MGPVVKESVKKRPANWQDRPEIWQDMMVEVRETFRRVENVRHNYKNGKFRRPTTRSGGGGPAPPTPPSSATLSRNRRARTATQAPLRRLQLPARTLREIQSDRSQPPFVWWRHLQNLVGMCRRINAQSTLTERRKNPHDPTLHPVYLRRPIDRPASTTPRNVTPRSAADIEPPYSYAPRRFTLLLDISNRPPLAPPPYVTYRHQSRSAASYISPRIMRPASSFSPVPTASSARSIRSRSPPPAHTPKRENGNCGCGGVTPPALLDDRRPLSAVPGDRRMLPYRPPAADLPRPPSRHQKHRPAPLVIPSAAPVSANSSVPSTSRTADSALAVGSERRRLRQLSPTPLIQPRISSAAAAVAVSATLTAVAAAAARQDGRSNINMAIKLSLDHEKSIRSRNSSSSSCSSSSSSSSDSSSCSSLSTEPNSPLRCIDGDGFAATPAEDDDDGGLPPSIKRNIDRKPNVTRLMLQDRSAALAGVSESAASREGVPVSDALSSVTLHSVDHPMKDDGRFTDVDPSRSSDNNYRKLEQELQAISRDIDTELRRRRLQQFSVAATEIHGSSITDESQTQKGDERADGPDHGQEASSSSVNYSDQETIINHSLASAATAVTTVADPDHHRHDRRIDETISDGDCDEQLPDERSTAAAVGEWELSKQQQMEDDVRKQGNREEEGSEKEEGSDVEGALRIQFSADIYSDFKESMMKVIMSEMKGAGGKQAVEGVVEQVHRAYMDLNPSHHHAILMDVVRDIKAELGHIDGAVGDSG